MNTLSNTPISGATAAGSPADQIERYRAAKFGTFLTSKERTDAVFNGAAFLAPRPYQPDPVHIDELRSLVRARMRDAFARSARWHDAKNLPAALRRRSDFNPLRYFMGEEAGSGKTSAFALVCGESAKKLKAGWNILYFAKNTKNSDDVARRVTEQLAKHGVTDGVINVKAAHKLCHNVQLLPKIEKSVKAGFPVADICKGCPLKASCKYQRTLVPERGKVIIMQMAHVRVGRLPPLGEGAGPVLLSFFDESPLAELTRTVELQTSFAIQPIRVHAKKVNAESKSLSSDPVVKAAELARRKQAAEDKALEYQTTANRVLDYLLALSNCQIIPKEKPSATSARIRIPMLHLDTVLGMELDGNIDIPPNLRSRTNALMEAFSLAGEDCGTYRTEGARDRFYAETLQNFRAELNEENTDSAVKLSMRGYAEANLRLIDSLAFLMTAIAKNRDRQDHISTLTVTEYYPRTKRGDKRKRKPTRTIGATMIAEIPAVITNAPIIFSDATGDVKILGRILGEETSNWKITGGCAQRPFAKTLKIIGQPTASSQLRDGALVNSWIAGRSGRVKLEGNLFEDGFVTEDKTRKEIDLDAKYAHSNAKNLERLIYVLTHQRRGKAGGIIGPKSFVTALSKMPWFKELNLVVGHHGAVAGKNDWERCDYLIVLGQLRPPVWAAEDVALGLALNDQKRRPIRTTGVFLPIDTYLYGQNGFMREVSHEDPLIATVLDQMCAGQQRQAYDRLRVTNRQSAEEACELIVADTVASDVTWDDLQFINPVNELGAYRAVHGREPAGAADALRTAPWLFKNYGQAKKRLRELRASEVAHNSPDGNDVTSSTPALPASYTYRGSFPLAPNIEPPPGSIPKKRGKPSLQSPELIAALRTAVAHLGGVGRRKLGAELNRLGHRISPASVGRLLKTLSPGLAAA